MRWLKRNGPNEQSNVDVHMQGIDSEDVVEKKPIVIDLRNVR